MREGKRKQAEEYAFFFQHRGEKEARLLPFLPFVPLSRGEGAEINAHHSPGCSQPSEYVGPDTSCLFCEQFGD